MVCVCVYRCDVILLLNTSGFALVVALSLSAGGSTVGWEVSLTGWEERPSVLLHWLSFSAARCAAVVNRLVVLQELLERVDYSLKKVLQRDPLTNDEVIMELYREIAMQCVLFKLHSVCQ